MCKILIHVSLCLGIELVIQASALQIRDQQKGQLTKLVEFKGDYEQGLRERKRHK